MFNSFQQKELLRKEREKACNISDELQSLYERETELIEFVTNLKCTKQDISNIILKTSFLLTDTNKLLEKLRLESGATPTTQYIITNNLAQRLIALKTSLNMALDNVNKANSLETIAELQEFAKNMRDLEKLR